MALLLNRVFGVPVWVVVVGLVALSSSPQPLPTAGVVVVSIVVVASAVLVTLALRNRSNALWPIGVQRTWHRAHHDRALDETDAKDLMRMDSDKG